MFNIFKKKTEEALKRTKESWFGKISGIFERPKFDEGMWDELEELLLVADVGVNTTTKLVLETKERVKREKLVEAQQVRSALSQEIVKILQVDSGSATADFGNFKPEGAVGEAPLPKSILVVGVNGSGKTTTIAKLAYNFKKEGKRVILSSADTFRAAAIDQLKVWGERVGAEVIAHQPGADPGAVVFDTLQAAKPRQAQIVIIDTAGRLHTKFNLMEELKKIKRVIQRINPQGPDETLLVLDATTGQNGLSQATYFTQAIGVSGIVLAKLDSTAKGGIVLAICDQLKIPIKYIGTGETLEDLAPFDAPMFVEALMS